MLLSVVVGALLPLALAQAASAATFTVTDPTDAALSTATGTSCASTNSGSCTLRAAVQAADNTGGSNTISLPSGDYKLTIPPACATYTSATTDLSGCDANDPSRGDLDVLSGVTITITGAGSGSTTVDAAGVDRAFAVANGGSLSLSGMTIEDGLVGSAQCNYTTYGYSYTCYLSDISNFGSSPAGGGVYSDGALATTATAGDVVFHDNQGPSAGGAIYADSDSTGLSLVGATFTGNYASEGSAIYDLAPIAATISGSTFSGNDTSGGEGTIYGNASSALGSLDVTGSTFSGNTSGNGGVFYWSSPASLSAEFSTFSGNAATTGGVIYNTNSGHSTSFTGDVIKDNFAFQAGVIYEADFGTESVTFNNDEVDSNRATYEGVGDFSSGGGLTSTNSSYIGNSGAYGGAFDFITTQPSELTNVTMSSNSSNYGGAIYLQNSTSRLDLDNDTIAYNSATGAGGGIYGAPNAVAGPLGGVMNTIVAENTGGDCGGGAFVAAADAGNNLDSDASCFGYSGAPASDLAGRNPLLSQPAANGGSTTVLTDAEHANSPTVDAGSNAGCPPTDARGLTRPMTASDPCDIGAFELLSAPLAVTSSAPAASAAGLPFTVIFTIARSTAGGPSTGTALSTRLPTGEILYGASASQGSCQSSGSPATVTCQLGTLALGATTTVQLVVALSTPGEVTNIALATNDEGQSQTTSAITLVAALSTPPPAQVPPTATTAPAGGVTTSAATLSGLINPGGQPTAFFFQYGTDTNYGGVSSIGHTGSTSTIVSAALSGLTANTTYHYRLVAINDSGTSYGSDVAFTTASTYRGAIRLARKQLSVKSRTVLIALKCTSASACRGRITIVTSLEQAGHGPHSVTCTSRHPYRVAAHSQKTVKAPIAAACRTALTGQGKLATNLTLHPTTPQPAVIQRVNLVL